MSRLVDRNGNNKLVNDTANKRSEQLSKVKIIKEKRELDSSNMTVDINSYSNSAGRQIVERIVIKPNNNQITTHTNSFTRSNVSSKTININHEIRMRERSSVYLSSPLDASGSLVDISDRPVICSAVSEDGSEVAVGSADHAVYRIHVNEVIRNNKSNRLYSKLYSKSFGHCDWITCLDYLKDGSKRIVSGGMDGKLCLWRGSSGNYLTGAHVKSISRVTCLANIAFSSCYDGRIGVWQLSNQTNRSLARVMTNNSEDPINEQCLLRGGNCLASGHKSGYINIWDVEKGVLSTRLRAHPATITSITSENSEVLVSGAVDGFTKVWDLRLSTGYCLSMNDGLVVSGGADSRIAIQDVRRNYEVSDYLSYHNTGVYTIVLHDQDCMLSSDGVGRVVSYDLKSKQIVYGLQASERGAVVSVSLGINNTMITGAQDGRVIVYQYQ